MRSESGAAAAGLILAFKFLTSFPKTTYNKPMKRSLEEKLLNPRLGSKAAAAKEFGIDLTLLLENLRLTPDQRIRNLQISMLSLEKFNREIRRSRKAK
jgi:hypothetical protein